MTHDLRHFEDSETLTLPETESLFASPEVLAAAPAIAQKPQPTKVAGSADSSRNSRSTRKAPGGRDASQQKDGG